MVSKNQEKLIKIFNSGILFKYFSLFKLPMVLITGMKIIKANQQTCITSVRYKYLNKNPFRSTYFAVLGMAAELSTGVLAMISLGQQASGIAFIITRMSSEFHKKARGRTTFKCEEGKKISKAIRQVEVMNEPITVSVTSLGRDDDGELVASFEFEWSFKKREK